MLDRIAIRLLDSGGKARLRQYATSRIATNAAWLLFDKITRAVLGLLIGAWVARYLGPAQYGTLAYAIALVTLFQAIATLSADAIIVRDIVQQQEAAAEIMGTAAALRLGLGCVCWLLAVATAAVFNPADGRVILMTAVIGGLLFFQVADVIDLWFQSQSQSRRTVVAKLGAYLLSSGAKALLVTTGAPLEAFAWVTAFDGAACAVGLFIAYRSLPLDGRWKASIVRARTLVSEAWPFALSGVSIMVYVRIDQLMIKAFLGDAALGIYAAAMPLSQFWQVIPITLATSLAPMVARRRTGDAAAYRRTLVLIFRAFFYLGVLSVVLTWALSHILVDGLFGRAYGDTVRVLDVHVVSNIFCFLGVAHGLWLVNARRFAVRLYGTALAAIVTATCNWVLLPRLGVSGAAYAAIAAQFTAAFLANAILDRESFKMQCEALLFKNIRGAQ